MNPILSNPLYPQEETLLITNSDGWYNIQLNRIIYCQSNNTSTEFILADGQKIFSGTHLMHYERLLAAYGFFRVHQSYLINTRHLINVKRNNNIWCALMDTHKLVRVAERKKSELFEMLQKQSIERENFLPGKTPESAQVKLTASFNIPQPEHGAIIRQLKVSGS